jgi:hypothetical protein
MLRIPAKAVQFGRDADVFLIGGYQLCFVFGFSNSSIATHANGVDCRVWIHAPCKGNLDWHSIRPEQATPFVLEEGSVG